MSAPGRVEVDPSPLRPPLRPFWAYCESGCPKADPVNLPIDGDPFPFAFPTIAAASDALRAHLATEHGELFQRCHNCLGSGVCCPVCHGYGWTYTERKNR